MLLILFIGVALTSCNNEEKKTAAETTETKAATTDAKLPYTLATPYRSWQIADNNDNTIAAMACLKAFVDKDYTAMSALMADSIQVRLDGYAAKMSRDSATKVFTAQRQMYSDLTITMYDYESVISGDKKEEYVTLWYKQAWKDDKGKADSLNIVDDCKMKNGKMIELDEKVQHFPAKN